MAIKIKGVFADVVKKEDEIKSPYPYWLKKKTAERIRAIKEKSGVKDYDTLMDKFCTLAEVALKDKSKNSKKVA